MRNPAHRRTYPDAADRMRAAAEGWQKTRASRERNQRRREDRAERDREAQRRGDEYVAEIERGRKRRRKAATPRGKRRSTGGIRPRKRARVETESDSDDDLTMAELRQKVSGKRRQVQGIREQWLRDGLGGERGKKRKPGQ